MHDDSDEPFIEELIRTVRDGPARERHVHLVLENHNNQARLLGCVGASERPRPTLPRRPGEGKEIAGTITNSSLPRPPGEGKEVVRTTTADAPSSESGDDQKELATSINSPLPRSPGEGRVGALFATNSSGAQASSPPASCVTQWNDDFHHAIHVALTEETDGYYEDFAEQPLQMLARTLAEGFAFQGEKSRCSGEIRGEPSGHLTPLAFVNFLQNHDQIGNRAFGERLAMLSEPEPLRAGYAVLLLAPQTPMLFMGEEYAAYQPFLYFCDYQGELAAAITAGRRKEFAKFRQFADEQTRQRIPDPNARESFAASQLDWKDRDVPEHRSWLDYVRTLLDIRRRHIVPAIAAVEPCKALWKVQDGVVCVTWLLHGGARLILMANLSPTASALPIEKRQPVVFSSSSTPIAGNEHLSAWEVRLVECPPQR